MNLNIKTSSLFTACAAGAISLICTSLVAIAFVPKETVKFQDLNVDSPADVAALYQRLHTAAMHVCYAESMGDPIEMKRAEACTNEAEARAVSRVNVSGLTAYYQMKTGRQVLALAASSAR